MSKSSPSLRDVARVAGVSLGTASRALNNKSNVLPETRALVLKTAADMGYKLQMRVATPVASRINTIGVAVKRDPGELPRLDGFNYAVLCGVEDECERLGLNLMYASITVDAYSRATAWSPLLENDEFDALIVIGVVLSQPEVLARLPRKMSAISVDCAAPCNTWDSILTNNIQGAYDAVSYLIEQGHQHIGLIGSDSTCDEHPSIRDRRTGYLKALQDHEIHDIYIGECRLHGESAYHATRQLLQCSPQLTAIFACNDDVARHVIKAAESMRLDVPADISVIGFDDTADSLNTQPLLTTVRVDKELMGAMAVRQLYERSANLDRPPITSIINTRLILRDSVKCMNTVGDCTPH